MSDRIDQRIEIESRQIWIFRFDENHIRSMIPEKRRHVWYYQRIVPEYSKIRAISQPLCSTRALGEWRSIVGASPRVQDTGPYYPKDEKKRTYQHNCTGRMFNKLLYKNGKAIRYSVRIGDRIMILLMSLNSFQSSSLKIAQINIPTIRESLKKDLLLIQVLDQRFEFRTTRNGHIQRFRREERFQIEKIKIIIVDQIRQ